MGLLSDIVSAPAQLFGSITQRDDSRKSADHAADRQDAAASTEMQFQERMSNSAYQRATTDMKAAGINPMVAFQQGGASTPNGAMGSAPAAQTVDMGKMVSTAMDALRLDNETKNADSQKTISDASATKALADAGASGSSAKQSDATTATILSQLKAVKAEADAREKKAGYDSSFTKYDAYAGRAARDSGTAVNVMRAIKGALPGGSTGKEKPENNGSLINTPL